MLRPTQSEGQLIGGKLGSRSARLEHSAEGNQGRLASVCAELLPALPAGRAPGRDDRHVDRPYRLSLHRSGGRLEHDVVTSSRHLRPPSGLESEVRTPRLDSTEPPRSKSSWPAQRGSIGSGACRDRTGDFRLANSERSASRVAAPASGSAL